MKSKVARVTQVLFEEGKGNADVTAKLFANFVSQRVVSPFLAQESTTPQQRFADNVLKTLAKAKKVARKPGCPADMLRRNILAAGAAGPLTEEPVCHIFILILF